jgi:hypothetical protein
MNALAFGAIAYKLGTERETSSPNTDAPSIEMRLSNLGPCDLICSSDRQAEVER